MLRGFSEHFPKVGIQYFKEKIIGKRVEHFLRKLQKKEMANFLYSKLFGYFISKITLG